ncbi:DUF3306 domain-containing protein [Epibacterium ulvae]|uniref:DUF3306 domain-containing protein n=1 Tax=Epibacterium ulvae TaxID=1156985 RepID=UPI001BFC8306|nr:DUF3306 domain-containing protein [Epibacterium ulvae]MBT8153175.1 DUF3306 domain-containing protein [Epibacterium ulvae]
MSDVWARRKAAVEAEAKVESAAVAPPEQAVVDSDLSDAEILEQLELPDPETLGEGDDFKIFWSKAVPSRIRTRALRRLWRVNPILANVDGLVDYGEDFTDATLLVEGMETAYQVGKGMTVHVEELARQVEEATNPTELVLPDDDLEDEPQTEAEPPVWVETQPLGEADTAPNMYPEEEPQPVPIGRMRFHFHESTQA